MNLEKLAKENNTSVELLQQLPKELLQKLISKKGKRSINSELELLLPQNNKEDKLKYLHCLLNVYHNSELEEESNEIREYIETNNVDTDVLEKVIISYIKKLFKDEDFKLREDKTKHNNEVENNLTPFE